MAKQKQPLTEIANELVEKLGPSPIDPIEAAKGSDASTAEVEQPAAAAPAAPVAEPTIPEPTVVKSAQVFEVMNGPITVSWGMQMVRFKTGDEVSEDSYGDGAIERFRALGVALREKV